VLNRHRLWREGCFAADRPLSGRGAAAARKAFLESEEEHMSGTRSIRLATRWGSGLAILLGLCFVAPSAHAAGAGNSNTVLVDGTGNLTAANVDKAQAEALGFTVELVTSSTVWAGKTLADFKTYKAISIPDNMCAGPSGAALANRAIWAAAVTGNILAVGGDPELHSPYSPGAGKLVQNGIGFAADDPGKTGLFVALGCGTGGGVVMDQFGSFSVQYMGSDSIHIVAVHPALNGLTDALLSNWGSSTHLKFVTFPSNFIPLAIQTNGTNPGLMTFADGTSGTPFLLVRGSGVQPVGLNITKSGPATASIGDNITYTLTYGNSGGTNATGTVVKDPVPAGTTFVSATGGGVLSGGVVTWSIGALSAKVTGQTVSFTARVDSPGAIKNTGYSIESSGVTPTVGADVTTTVACPANCTACTASACTACANGYTLVSGACAAITSTALTSSKASSTYGEAVRFTANVFPVAAAGSIEFGIDGTVFESVALVGGQAVSIFTSALAVGSHTVTATLVPSGTWAASSAVVSQVVNKSGASVAVASSGSTTRFGQTVSFSATVAPASASGSVQFWIDGMAFGGPVALAGGTASSSAIATLPVGTHAIAAAYLGDGSYEAASGSLAGGQVVNKATSSLTLATSNPSAVYGASLQFSAMVEPAGATGLVQFKIDGADFGAPVEVAAGAAMSLELPLLSAGSHTIGGLYLGDGSYLSSSATLAQEVAKASVSAGLALSPNPSLFGQAIAMTAKLTSPSGQVPTGSVAFLKGESALVTAGIDSSGKASAPLSTLAVGITAVVAAYSGDANHEAARSEPAEQTVEKAQTRLSISSSLNPALHGQKVVLTATIAPVAPVAPGAGSPAGEIAFYDGADSIGSATLSSGQAALEISDLAAGTRTLRGEYAGDESFLASKSEELSQAIEESCIVADAIWPAATVNPENPCQFCNPGSNATDWTNRASGFACPADALACTLDVCDGAGACTHPLAEGCLISGECIAPSALDPANECKSCNPALDPARYTVLPKRVACSDDGSAITDDYCDGAGLCTHPRKNQCWIDGAVVAGGAANPSNSCQVCDPMADDEGWTDRVSGFPCATDGLACTWDACDGAGLCRHDLFAGCLIDGACIATGGTDPANDCQECNPALATIAYSAKAKGVACADDGDDRTADTCDGSSACAHPTKGQCAIAGKLYDAGTTNPENICQSCDPASTASAWTHRGAGFPCTSDRLACTSDVCDGAGACGHLLFTGCLIGGECIGAGATDPTSQCQTCDPARATDGYVAKARGVLCGDDGDDKTADFCDGESGCIHELKGLCSIGGKVYAAGEANPANGCESCDPASSVSSFTSRASGFPCASDGLACTRDVCDGAGTCTHPLFTGCLIDGACIGTGSLDPTGDCRACDPGQSTASYTPAPRGLTCADDGSATTLDACDGTGLCVHPLRGQCTIGGASFDAGTVNPQNPCQSCDPAASASAWTDRVAGFPCTEDGLACTRDACDGAGACKHELFTGCLIGGECVATGEASPANECQHCDPASATGAFTDAPRSMACSDDGDDKTADFCDGAGGCIHKLKGLCTIDGKTFEADAANPENPCEACEPAFSVTTWSFRTAGFPCTNDGLACTHDVCDGFGACNHPLFTGCMVDGACIGAGSLDPKNDCRACAPALATDGYSAAPAGVSCADDGDATTADVCDGAAACVHPTKGQCRIGEATFDAGATNPANPCQSCDPTRSASAWSDRVAGFPCTEDGLLCTADVCDGVGACRHDLFAGCLIGGACIAVGEADPANECQACNPELASNGYTAKAAGLACSDDGAPNTLDVCDGSGGCVHPLKGQCLIGAKSFDSGTADPENPCQSCDPAANEAAWTARVAGFPCPSDGLACTTDVCDGKGRCGHAIAEGCVIGNACVAAGAADPQDACFDCNPAVSATEYSLASSAQCAGACQGDADCGAGTYCEAAVCRPQFDDGSACQAEAQCQSGRCIDGQCMRLVAIGGCSQSGGQSQLALLALLSLVTLIARRRNGRA
jgi:uncharacterized repeat protein (TIGR01451 family)